MNSYGALASNGSGWMIFSIIMMVFGLVWMVLAIILFCKVWRMTNDVHKMKGIMERREASQATSNRRFASSTHPGTPARPDESGEGGGSSSEPYWKDHSRYAPPGV